MKNTFVLLSAIFVLCFVGIGKAQAHATPINYEPEASSLLEKIPERVRIYFSERIEQGASGITVYGPDGERVDNGDAAIGADNPRSYGAGIKDGGEGTYTISWQVVSSDDGHFTKGAFSFSVGKETGSGAGSGQIQIQHITTIPQAGTIGIELVGQAIILGTLVFFALLWRPFRRKFTKETTVYETAIRNRFTLLMVAGVALVAVGAISFIVLKTFDLQQLRPGDFFTTFQTFLGTIDGSYALARAVLAVLLLVSFFVVRKAIFAGEKITKGEILLFILFSTMIFARARVSHAAASHFYPLFSILVNAGQLLFKELWVGGLIVFSTAIAPLLLRAKNINHFAFISTVFSKLASISFGAVGITGAYIVWLHLKDPSYIFSTQWGARLIILSIFGGILLAVRLYHQFIVDKSVLAICKGVSKAKEGRAVSWAIITLPLEMLVGVALLFVTSFIIITTPPYVSEKFTFEQSAVSQGVEINMSIHPYETARFLIVADDAKKKTAIPLTDIVVTLTNEEKGIGPIVVDTEQRFDGGYVFSQNGLSPSGKWKIDITARRTGAYDAVASFAVDYPKDITATRIDPDKRSIGLFEVLTILGAILILALTLFLYRFSKRTNETCAGLSLDFQERNEDNIAPPKQLFSWTVSFIVLAAISYAVWFSYGAIAKSSFQRLCEKNGHFWFQSVPVRDGQALSQNTFTGCFLDVGFYHFADEREYKFFFKPREVLAEVLYAPKNPEAGTPTDFSIALSEIKDGKKIGGAKDIGVYHDRILHVQIVGEDLKSFAHIHPEDLGPISDDMKNSARFPLRYIFPKAGQYVLNVDYVASGRERSEIFRVNISGKDKMERGKSSTDEELQTKEFQGYSVTFTAPKTIKAGELIRLRYDIEKDGKPVKNLEPYLAAAMHIGIVRDDLARFSHTHGEAYQPGSVWFQQLFGKYFKYHIHFAPDQFGPAIITKPWTTVFPTAGIYEVFGEFKHDGKVIVTNFSVNIQ